MRNTSAITLEHQLPTIEEVNVQSSPDNAISFTPDKLDSARPIRICFEQEFDKTLKKKEGVAYTLSTTNGSPQIKTTEIETGLYESKGEEWLFMQFVQTMYNQIGELMTILGRQPNKLYYDSLCSVFILGAIILNLWVTLGQKGYIPSFVLPVQIILVIVDIALLACLISRNLSTCRGVTRHSCFTFMFILIQFEHFCISVSLIVAFGLSFVSLAYFYSALFFNLLAVLISYLILICILPLLVLGFFETLLRLILGKISCPDKKEKTKSYSYGLYNFNDQYANSLIICTICLGELDKNSSFCTLHCHQTHIFHEDCILEWIKNENGCPICRTPIKFNVKPIILLDTQ